MSTTLVTTIPWSLQIVTEVPPSAIVTDILVDGQSVKTGTLVANVAASNANEIIGAIEVITSDGSLFIGTIRVDNQGGGQCPFVVTNGGELPCNLAVGGASISANTYALQFQTTG